jgi:hypothetical protein
MVRHFVYSAWYVSALYGHLLDTHFFRPGGLFAQNTVGCVIDVLPDMISTKFFDLSFSPF